MSAGDYTVAPHVGNVSAGYAPSVNAGENLGMSFTQQFCDNAVSPTSCSATCLAVPCYRVTRVAGYQYATRASVLVIGSKIGDDAVEATVTVGGFASALLVNGVCQ
jgi:hypothetical protein